MSTVANIPAETRKAMIISIQNIHARMIRAENAHQQFELKKMKALLLSMMSSNMTQEGFDKLNWEYQTIKAKVILASPARVNEMAQKLEQKRQQYEQVNKETNQKIQHTNSCAAHYFMEQAKNLINNQIHFNLAKRQMHNSIRAMVQYRANLAGITDPGRIRDTTNKIESQIAIAPCKTFVELGQASARLFLIAEQLIGETWKECHK